MDGDENGNAAQKIAITAKPGCIYYGLPGTENGSYPESIKQNLAEQKMYCPLFSPSADSRGPGPNYRQKG